MKSKHNFFKSLKTDSSSATNSDSDTDSENIFYSTYHESKRVQPKPPLASVTQSSACSFRLNINQGLLTAYSPVRVSIYFLILLD